MVSKTLQGDRLIEQPNRAIHGRQPTGALIPDN